MFVFTVISIIAYILTLSLIVPGLLGKQTIYRRLVVMTAVIALAFHAASLHRMLYTNHPIDLIDVASAISLIIALIMTFIASHNRGWLLLPIVYSFAIINIILASQTSLPLKTVLQSDGLLLSHIILAMLAYATLLIAALYVLQFTVCDYQLKHKAVRFSGNMPPLMETERKLFHITLVGYVLLSLTLLLGFFYIEHRLVADNLDKIICSVVAWCIYSLLLWGHYFRHWRGRAVIWLNIIGISILTVGYFGSRLLAFIG